MDQVINVGSNRSPYKDLVTDENIHSQATCRRSNLQMRGLSASSVSTSSRRFPTCFWTGGCHRNEMESRGTCLRCYLLPAVSGRGFKRFQESIQKKTKIYTHAHNKFTMWDGVTKIPMKVAFFPMSFKSLPGDWIQYDLRQRNHCSKRWSYEIQVVCGLTNPPSYHGEHHDAWVVMIHYIWCMILIILIIIIITMIIIIMLTFFTMMVHDLFWWYKENLGITACTKK